MTFDRKKIPRTLIRNALASLTALLAFAFLVIGCNGSGGGSGSIVSKSNSSKVCFRDVGPQITLNGDVTGDPGWYRSFRHIFRDAVGMEKGAFQVRKQGENVYLSIEVNDDIIPDDSDVVMLAFEPSGRVGEARLLIIKPFKSTASGGPLPGASVPNGRIEYWEGSKKVTQSGKTWVDWNDISNNMPSGISVHRSGTNKGMGKNWRWEVEVKLPASAVNLPSTKNFGLYLNAIVTAPESATSSGDDENTSQLAWPPNRPLDPTRTIAQNPTAIAFTPKDGVPALEDWGVGTLSPGETGSTCNGVFTTGDDDLYVGSGPNEGVTPGQPETFKVVLHNNSIDANGNFVEAKNIKGTFYARSRGTGPSYTEVATERNPVDVPPKRSGGSEGTEILKSGQSTFQRLTGPRPCIRVELDSDVSATTFINRGENHNIGWAYATSPFNDTLTVDLQNLELQSDAERFEVVLETYEQNTPFEAEWSTELENVGAGLQQTGEGAYGIEQTGDGTYRLNIGRDESVALPFRITPPDVDIPSETVEVEPQTRPGDVQIPVDAGNLLTLITDGSIRLPGRERRVGTFGAALTDREQDRELLTAIDHRGALVGSWDGFDQSAFFVGPSRSFKVPEGADSLSLALNDFEEGYQQQEGEGFQVQAVQTPVEEHFSTQSPVVRRDFSLEQTTPLEEMIPLGTNMPTWTVCGRVRTDRSLEINDKEHAIYRRIGCVSTIVREIQ